MKKASLLTATLILMCMTIDHSSREVSAVNEATKNTFRCKFAMYMFLYAFYRHTRFYMYLMITTVLVQM